MGNRLCHFRFEVTSKRRCARGQYHRAIGFRTICETLAPRPQSPSQNESRHDPHLHRESKGKAQNPEQDPEEHRLIQANISATSDLHSAGCHGYEADVNE